MKMGLFDGTVAELSIANGLLIWRLPAHGHRRPALRHRPGPGGRRFGQHCGQEPNDWSKGMVLCIIVEFYAILSLLISFLMIMFGF